jgi:hypothetical protein
VGDAHPRSESLLRVRAHIVPFGLPLQRVGMSLGAGRVAFLVTAALSGRAGVADLRRRSVRWRVPLIMSRTGSFVLTDAGLITVIIGGSVSLILIVIGELLQEEDRPVNDQQALGHDIARFARWAHQQAVTECIHQVSEFGADTGRSAG